MVLKLELIKQFKALGVKYDGPGVVDCCLELCGKYSLDGQVFVETWLAFSLSYLDGASPSLERLLQMEKIELKNSKLKLGSTAGSTSPKIVLYQSKEEACESPETQDCFNVAASPVIAVTESRKGSGVRTPKAFTHPPPGTPSPYRYSSRCDSGKTISSYNESPVSWKGEMNKRIEVTLVRNPLGKLPVNWSYMYDRLETISLRVNSRLTLLAESILRKNNMLDSDIFHPNSTDITSFVGYIECDDHVLIPNHVILEGVFYSEGQIEVDMTSLNEYLLFPGQVLVVRGKMCGKSLLAKELFFSASLPLPPVPEIKGPIKLLVAAAPFNHIGNYSYAPLLDLLEHAKTEEPDVLIIIGPALDANHVNAEDDKSTFFNISPTSYYKFVFSTIVESLKGTNTQVFYVSSYKDISNIPVYPTKPTFKSLAPEINFLPDPTMVSIHGINVGITSTDVLLHLGKRGVTKGGNRLHKLAESLLFQHHFYPLYPSDPEVAVDGNLWAEVGDMSVTPHILIVPSDLHHFIKVIEGCVVINPEKLAKGYDVGGFFCIIEARPLSQMDSEDESWTPASHISAKIIKI